MKWSETILITALVMTCSSCMDDSAAERAMTANPEFRVWCGQRACAWEVDAGEVEKVPTWHRRVYGLRLASDGATISQVIDVNDIETLVFELFAMVEPTATLHLEVDFDADDSTPPEYQTEVSNLDWVTVRRMTRVPEPVGQARIIVRKTGPGDAILSRLKTIGHYGDDEDTAW